MVEKFAFERIKAWVHLRNAYRNLLDVRFRGELFPGETDEADKLVNLHDRIAHELGLSDVEIAGAYIDSYQTQEDRQEFIDELKNSLDDEEGIKYLAQEFGLKL